MLLGKEAAAGVARMATFMRRPPARMNELMFTPLRSISSLSPAGALSSKMRIAAPCGHLIQLKGRLVMSMGGFHGALGGQVRKMSTDETGKNDQEDSSERKDKGPKVTVEDAPPADPNWKFSFRHEGDDEYAPHRQNLENALKWMREQAGDRELSEAELSDLSDRAIEKFIPPMPPLEVRRLR